MAKAIMISSENTSLLRRTNMGHVDALLAGQELRGLVQAGLVEQRGAGRWTNYALTASEARSPERVVQPDQEKILAYVIQHGSINNTECRNLLGIDDTRAYYILKNLCEFGKLRPIGKGKGRRYVAT